MIILSFEEYVTKLFEMVGKEKKDSELEIQNPSSDVLKLYDRYKEGIHEDFRADSDGVLKKFRNIPHQNSFATVFGSSAEFWFITADLRKYLLKNIIEFYDGNGSSYNTEVNSIICPQLAKQFGIDSALYYVLDYYDREGNKSDILVTPDFKIVPNEEMISGHLFVTRSIGYYEEELDVNNILIGLDDNLRLRKISPECIDTIKKDFLKQTLFRKLINDSDQNNYNWGIIRDFKKARLAPVYDYEYCFFNHKLYRTERTVGKDKKTDIVSFIQEYHEDWFIEWIENSINRFDFEKACRDATQETGVIINEEIKKRYKDFFCSKIDELNRAIEPFKRKSLNECEDYQK